MTILLKEQKYKLTGIGPFMCKAIAGALVSGTALGVPLNNGEILS
jgi:hypothetical protein